MHHDDQKNEEKGKLASHKGVSYHPYGQEHDNDEKHYGVASLYPGLLKRVRSRETGSHPAVPSFPERGRTDVGVCSNNAAIAQWQKA